MDENELRVGGKERAHLASRALAVKAQSPVNNAALPVCYAPR
jgi:hypothetical protein